MTAITVLNRSARTQQMAAARDGATLIDLTSRATEPWRRFSPFYPHGDIPIPLWPERTATSVEGIWQGLKRFEYENVIDARAFDNATMHGLKRTSRARGAWGRPRGRVLGHQAGRDACTLLGYVDARRLIYLPAYHWVLENRLHDDVEHLRSIVNQGRVVLLDYTSNGDPENLSAPLSHAALVKAYIEGVSSLQDARGALDKIGG